MTVLGTSKCLPSKHIISCNVLLAETWVLIAISLEKALGKRTNCSSTKSLQGISALKIFGSCLNLENLLWFQEEGENDAKR